MPRHLAFIAAALAAFVLADSASGQQRWPQRPVRIVVPLPAGSAVDLTSRLFAERLAQKWGQGVVVENRLGADGIVAVTSFLGARDDHQLLISFGGVVSVNPLLNKELQYDPNELTPISVLVDNYLGIAASAEMNAPTMADVVRLARAAPGQFTWAATPGQTGVIMPALLKLAGIDALRVSYSNFTMALQDLAQGRLHLAATSLPALLPVVQSGKARLLMVTNRQRSPQVPDAPTAAEAGYPAITVPGSVVLFTSKDTPAERKEQIAAAIAEVAKEPALVDKLNAMGITVRASTPADAARELTDQRGKIEAALKLIQ